MGKLREDLPEISDLTFGDKFMLLQILFCLMPLMELGDQAGGNHDDPNGEELESVEDLKNDSWFQNKDNFGILVVILSIALLYKSCCSYILLFQTAPQQKKENSSKQAPDVDWIAPTEPSKN